MNYLEVNFIEDNEEKKLFYKLDDVNDALVAKKHFKTYHPTVNGKFVFKDMVLPSNHVIELKNCFKLISKDFVELCSGNNSIKEDVERRLMDHRGGIAFDDFVDVLYLRTEKVFNTSKECLKALKSSQYASRVYSNEYTSYIEDVSFNTGWGIEGTVYAMMPCNGSLEILDVAEFDETIIEVAEDLTSSKLINHKNLYYYRIKDEDIVCTVDDWGEVRYNKDLKFPKGGNLIDANLFLLNISDDDYWPVMSYDDFKTNYLDRYNYDSKEFVCSEECFNVANLECEAECGE